MTENPDNNRRGYWAGGYAMAAKITMEKILGGSELMTCDYCLHRSADYHVKFDNTWLCKVCLTKYLNEHGIKRYEVVLR